MGLRAPTQLTVLPAMGFLRGLFNETYRGARSKVPGTRHPALIGCTGHIPLVHRLTIIYLMLPVVVWLTGWFEWWFGLPFAVILALAFRRALSGAWLPATRPVFFVLLLVAAGWVMATAAGGVFDVHNFDWIKHRALLLDLAQGTWPVYLPGWLSALTPSLPADVDLSGFLLRYNLGYYMVPGLLGRWFGVGALNWAVPLWTWLGVVLMLVMFTRGFAGWRALAAAVILIFFSGMDILSVLLFEGWDWLDFRLTLGGRPDLWLGRDYLEWDRYLDVKVQIPSHMVGLMWAPQHLLAGVLYALLLVQLRGHTRFLAISGVVVGASLFWSPFVAVGLLPLVVVLLIENGVRPFLRWQNLLLALPLAVLLIAYLSSGTREIPHFWSWEIAGWRNVVRGLPTLYAIEFLGLALLLILLRPQLLRRPFFIASLATMSLLPLYYFGLHNDLVMRGLIPATVLLCYYCADSIFSRSPNVTTGSWRQRRVFLTSLIAGILVIGAIGPVINLTRANASHGFGQFRYDQFGPENSIVHAVAGPVFNQYLTDSVPDWLRHLLRNPAGTQAPAESELLANSVFDVYLIEERILAFVKNPCTQDDVNARFLLSVFPLEDKSARHRTLDFAFGDGAGMAIGTTCVASRPLPDIEIGRVRFGQYRVDRSGHRWMASYYREEFRERALEEAGEPIIRSNYAVYMYGKWLIYSKASCTERDVAAPFSLRLTPVDVNAVDEIHRERGFEEFNFTFAEIGDWIGDGCLVVHELPEYAILSLRTGQYIPGEGALWEGVYTFRE